MRLGDVGSYALGNLKRHKLRTTLTCAGVAVGVSTLTVMVSLGAGLEKLVTDQFSADEFTTRITVTRLGGNSSPFDMKKKQVPEGEPITDAVIARLDKLPGVLAAYPDVSTPLTVEIGDQAASAGAYGLPLRSIGEPYQRALKAGRYWTAEDAGPVCVLPSQLARELGYSKPEQAIGAKVAVSEYLAMSRYEEVVEEKPDPSDPKAPPIETTHWVRPQGLEVTELDVIGVYDSKKYGYMGMQLHVPLSEGKALNDQYPLFRFGLKEGEYRAAMVKVGDHRKLDEVRKRIEGEGFATQTVFDILSKLQILFVVFEVLLSFFGGIGLVVAFFGIANTMVMAVMERVREIGVLKALGARNRDIRRIFFVEAGAIGLGGGALGVGFGWAVGLALNAVALTFLPADADATSLELFYVPGWLIGMGLGVSTFVSMIAGIYPAWRAARQDPVEALRRE